MVEGRFRRLYKSFECFPPDPSTKAIVFFLHPSCCFQKQAPLSGISVSPQQVPPDSKHVQNLVRELETTNRVSAYPQVRPGAVGVKMLCYIVLRRATRQQARFKNGWASRIGGTKQNTSPVGNCNTCEQKRPLHVRARE